MAKNILKSNYPAYFEQLRVLDTSYIDNVLDSQDNVRFSLENIAKNFSFKQLIDDELITNPNIVETDFNKKKNKYSKIDKNFDNIDDPIYEIDNARDKVDYKSSTTKQDKQKIIVKNKLKNLKTQRY